MNDENEKKEPQIDNSVRNTPVQLGSYIEIEGGRFDKTTGRVYYLDDSMIRILPGGLGDRVISFDIEDGFISEKYGIEDLYVTKVRKSPSFAVQQDYRVGQMAEAFKGSEAELVGTYIIEQVNEQTDSVVLRSIENNESRTIVFNFNGIPFDEGIDVLRGREVAAVPDEQDSHEETAEREAIEEEEEEIEYNEEIIETIVGEQIQELESEFRQYSDVAQRSDMLQDFISKLELKAQKNPLRIKEIRRLTELCMLLRNEVVEYNTNGEPVKAKSTSFNTLNDLVISNASLSRPVMNVKRMLYLDSEPELTNASVVIRSLGAAVESELTYAETEFAGNQNTIGDFPNWYLGWEKFNKEFFRSWVVKDVEDAVAFSQDKDFFRMPYPDDNTTSYVDGLPKIDYPTEGKNAIRITPEFISTVYISLLRGLKGRYGRLKEKEPARLIESPDKGEIDSYLLFPKIYERELGVIRSGKLAYDIGRSIQPLKTLESIIKSKDGVSNFPTVDSILAVKNNVGLILVETWLEKMPLTLYGLSDALVELKSYGFAQKEFYYKQQVALIDKINESIAHVKSHIQYIRTKAQEKKPVEFENKNILQPDSYEITMEILKSQDTLRNYITQLQARMPFYKQNDLALLAGLFYYVRELTIATLAGFPANLTKYRIQFENKVYNHTLQHALSIAIKTEEAKHQPEVNSCEHVQSLNTIRKVKDDAQRMQLIAKYLAQYRAYKKDNFIICKLCDKACLCEHEYLMLREYQVPREKDTLHKELLLHFSGGVFQGKFICSNCGQSISNLDFENSLEYDDNGAPMSGSSALIDASELENKEFNLEFGISLPVQEITFESPRKTLYYQKTRELFDNIGIFPDGEAYVRIVNLVDNRVESKLDRITYAKAEKAAKAQKKRVDSYDVYINKAVIGSILAYVLIEIQTHIPSYVPRSSSVGCAMDFRGYPLGAKDDLRAMEYIACTAVILINKHAKDRDANDPWFLCGFTGDKQNKTLISYISLVLDDVLTSPDILNVINRKKEELRKIFGKSEQTDGLKEIVPHRFTPILYSDIEEVIVPDAANDSERIRGYILETHKHAKESIKKDLSPFSERTCCLGPIQNAKSFWSSKNLTTLPPRHIPRGPINSHSLLPFILRTQQRIKLDISKDEYYKLFLQVCYTGTNIGLSHEFGYNNTCPYCEFKMPNDISQGVTALKEQNVEINQESFQELLDAVHIRNSIPHDEHLRIDYAKTFSILYSITPAPFDNWRELLQKVYTDLQTLEDGSSREFAEIYGAISSKASESISQLRERLGNEDTDILIQILNQPIRQIIESVESSILLPLQRIYSGYNLEQLTIPKTATYKDLEDEIKNDIYGFISVHTNFLKSLKDKLVGFAKSKVQYAIQQMSIFLKTLQSSIRISLLKGGYTGLPYIIKAGIAGILCDMVDSSVVVPTNDLDNTTFDVTTDYPTVILKELLVKYQSERFKLTDDQIRIEIAKRNEKEKMLIISKLDRMTKEEKAVELLKKKYGMGEWAVGGTKAIFTYDPDQYIKETHQRAEMDALGIEAAEPGAEAGYDNDQVGDDNW